MISRRNFLMLSAAVGTLLLGADRLFNRIFHVSSSRTLKKSVVEKVLKIGSTRGQTVYFPRGRRYLVKDSIIIESNNTFIDFNGAHLTWIGDDDQSMIEILDKVRSAHIRNGNFHLANTVLRWSL